MEEKDDTEQLLRSAALQTASSILLLRQRAEQELIRAKQSLELKTEELAKSLSMMQATLDSTTDGILATDDAGRVTTFNEKFVQMWQIPSTAIDCGDERQLWGTLLPNLCDPNRYLARLEEIYTTSPEETFDLVEFADGRVFERYSKLQTIENRGVGRVWSFRDVTERLGRERALEEIYQAEQRARADAEHANLAKDHFLAALSHELRTPLTPVLALLYGLKENSELPRSVAEDIETIRRNVELEARLIDDLLDLTRITRGKAELHCESVRIGQVIEDAIQTCLAEITQKNLQLVQKIERPQQIIRADAARLTQILWNLLKNAVKFTPPGGVITILSYVANEDDRARVIIEVSDSGLGIEPEQLGVIFDAFEQGDRKITRQFGGLGLGLAISKAIADLHQATLTATSRGLHRGATFTLSLPFSPLDPIAGTEPRPVSPEPHHQTHIAGSEPGPRRTARILLVEDHVDTAKALERLLRRMGHEVVSANSIASALRVAEEEPNRGKLDLLISDLGLPDGSGLALMKSLSSTYGLPGIALSGYGMEQDLSESFAAGFSRHLTKPVDIGEVQAAIDNLVAQR